MRNSSGEPERKDRIVSETSNWRQCAKKSTKTKVNPTKFENSFKKSTKRDRKRTQIGLEVTKSRNDFKRAHLDSNFGSLVRNLSN